MITSMKSYMNWSGGKDSSLSLLKVLHDKSYNVHCLLTNVNAVTDRISMHGVRRSLLKKQADAIGIPLQTIDLPAHPTMDVYEQAVAQKIAGLKSEGFTTAIFGDIFLEDLRTYREQKLAMQDINCEFPLWKMDTHQLMNEFIALGFKAIVVSVNEQFLDRSFCGRLIDQSFLRDLPANVDPCGENGEYHSFVFDGPIFQQAVPFQKGEIVSQTYPAPTSADLSGNPMDRASDYIFHFCDLV